jgi:catechol 2,3-dioxygenase-like lactoylglutathione lyase family enzyme
MITGLNHLTLGVSNLDQSFRFYTDVLGLRPVLRWAEGAYLLAGEFWIALILDEEQSRGSNRGYSHVALSVEQSDFERLSDRIRVSGARIWQKNQSEGPSLYFTDPDGHKLELHASDLSARLQHKRLHVTPDMHFFDDTDVKTTNSKNV